MPNEMNDWGRRLDAGETDDAELKLAARLRAARPPVLSMPSATEAAIRARVLNNSNAHAKPRFGFAWPRWNLGWWAGTALAGVILTLFSFMFSVLSQPLPASGPTADPVKTFTGLNATPDFIETLQANQLDQVRIVSVAPSGGWLTNQLEVTVAYTLTDTPTATLQIAFVNPNWDGEFVPVENRMPWEEVFSTEVTRLGDNQYAATIIINISAENNGAELARLAEENQVALYASLTAVSAQREFSRLAYHIARQYTYQLPTTVGCTTPNGLDRAVIKSVSVEPNSQLPNAPTAFEVEVEYQLSSAPVASLILGWADPAWTGEPIGANRVELFRYVSHTTSLVVSAQHTTARLRGLIFDPALSASVARDGRLALWVALACGPAGAQSTWLYSHVWPDHTYFVPTPNTANAVSIASASLTPGATLPGALTPINVTVNYTLTTAPTATLQIGLANAEWPGSEVDARAGTIFAVGAQPVVVTADKNSVTVPFYYEPISAAQMFSEGWQVNLFATLSYQTETGAWARLAYQFSPEFFYLLPISQ